MPTGQILMVPIHLDALLLRTERAVVDATADFTRLPYFDGTRDVNGDSAYLSEAILSSPFQNRNLYLPPGVHLHWSLPDALTRARRAAAEHQDEDPDDQDGQDKPGEFPRVPNRWLVVRSRSEDNWRIEKAWMVESDYLHPEGTAAESGSASYPIKLAEGSHSTPFRYLGRALTLDAWQERDPQAEYLDSLTAVGYGEPTFAALYANCRNVFGLHDGDYTTPPEGLRYDLVGWYGDVGQDYVRVLIAMLKAEQKLKDATPLPADTLLARLAEQARWAPLAVLPKQRILETFSNGEAIWSELIDKRWIEPIAPAKTSARIMARSWRSGRPLGDQFNPDQAGIETILEQVENQAVAALSQPGRVLCYARLTFAASQGGQGQADEHTDLKVAMGNTGPQALSAYLADTLRREQPALAGQPANQSGVAQPTLEDRLEAILLAPRLRDRRLDVDAKFREARHEIGFTALQSGHMWTLRQQPREQRSADAAETNQQKNIVDALTPDQRNLLDQISHALNALNLQQQEYDRSIHAVESLRWQLFADWYRFLLCLYPVEGTGEDYPDVNEVKYFIEQAMLPHLQAQVERTGRLEHRHDKWDAPYPVALDTNPTSLAAAVARAAGDLRGKLDQFNAIDAVMKANLAYRLNRTHTPRYWQPNNPVVLLAGEHMQPSVRHGQDGRARPDGLLECRIVDDVFEGSLPKKPAAIVGLIDKLAEVDAGEQIGFFTWTEQPWHPLLLEWELEVFPTAGRGNLDPQGGLYADDFITDNYAAAENEPDLAIKAGKGVLNQAANLYSGSSILTPYAHTFQGQRIATYVVSIYCKAKELPVPPEEQAEEYLKQRIEEVRAWHQAQQHDAQDADDSIRIALAAFDQLQKIGGLSQSLGSFNEALLTRKQTLQLDVKDPLAFDDYLPFIAAVQAGVGRSNRSAPQPLNDFNPIRSGALKLLRLRLVDTFGQMRDLDCSHVIATQQMTAGAGDGLVVLPPRLVQPARLNIRWLSADLGDQQISARASETPICGWVVPNHLDDSLMIYDGAGQALGVIDHEGQWQPAPGVARVEPTQIQDSHLKTMVAYLLDPARSASFPKHFHAALDSALEHIDPENFAQHQDLALLMGRPIALVRATVSLELQGLPAVHQGWNQFRQDIRRDTRDTDGFTGVQIPIRIGDYLQLNDGLVGYWKEAGDTFGDVFYAPQSEKIDDPSIQTHADGEPAILQSIDAPPQTLSMLVDPRGAVHAVCGVLPVKAIDIPAEQYADALGRIEVTFVSGPILTGPRQLGIPLPAEPGYAWSWLESEGDGWRETWTFPTIERQTFEQGLARLLWKRLLDRTIGWLRPIESRPEAADVVAAQDRAAPLGPELAAIEQQIERVLGQRPADSTSITLAAFVTAAGEAIGRTVWERLLEPKVAWLKALPGEPPRAQITLKSPAAAKDLQATYPGMERAIETVIDLYQVGIIPPSTAARFGGRQEVREGWLKLRVGEPIE